MRLCQDFSKCDNCGESRDSGEFDVFEQEEWSVEAWEKKVKSLMDGWASHLKRYDAADMVPYQIVMIACCRACKCPHFIGLDWG